MLEAWNIELLLCNQGKCIFHFHNTDNKQFMDHDIFRLRDTMVICRRPMKNVNPWSNT
jgi:hypothetical protein